MQAWYWRRFRSVVPYRLFALSNLASLLALLGFPVLFEPAFDLKTLAWAWSFLFAAFALLCAGTAWLSINGFDTEAKAAAPVDPVPLKNQLQWLALAAMGSVMLLAVTNHVTQNISSVPFLWVLPLALYLTSFILAFDHPRWYIRPAFVGALVVLVPADGLRHPFARPAASPRRSTWWDCSPRAWCATASSPGSSPTRRTSRAST